jgi:hypothetical protein
MNTGMTIDVRRIKDEIRALNPTDKTEICRWIDHEAAVDLLSRIGGPAKRHPKKHVATYHC